MYKFIKKHINYVNIFRNTSYKLISIFVVFLLLSTVMSSVVSSDNIRLNASIKDSENTDKHESPLKGLLDGKTIKERLTQLKEKIKYLKDKLLQLKNRLSDINNDETGKNQYIAKKTKGTFSSTTILNTLKDFLTVKNSAASLMFHTNYNGIEKDTKLILFGEVKIDVDDDPEQIEDIGVRLRLFPRIEKPLWLSINFELIITRLPGFPDPYASFEGYTDLYFPGIINANQKGDRIRFGYESPLGEEVPDVCKLTYAYLPHILSLTKRPEHKVKIDPGNIAGKSKLVLLLSYTNYDNETFISELCSRVIYDKAAISEMKIGGNGILGGSTFEFERTISKTPESVIDLDCSFEKDDTIIYGYAKDIPEKLTFTMDFGREGYIEFDTHNEPPAEIGIRDGTYVNRLFFTNLPSKARIEWERNILFEKKASINFYTEGPGISFNGYFEPNDNGTIEFSISSNENLNCSIELDTSVGYLIINRTEIDLSLSFLATGSNSSLDLSFNVSRIYLNPFEIFYKIDDKIEISLANKSFAITDFYLLVTLSQFNFGIKADSIVKNQTGLVTIILDYQKNNTNMTFNLTIINEDRLEIVISGLYIKFKDDWVNSPLGDPLIITSSRSFLFNFNLYNIEWDHADDWSWGYIFFRGGLYYETYHPINIFGLEGGVKGKIYAGANETDGFNLSWYTNTSKGYNLTKFNVTGAVFGIEDFCFYLGDMINLSISKITGSIQVFEACNESGKVIIELQGDQSSLDSNIYFSLTNESLFNFTFNVDSLHINLHNSIVYAEVVWADSNISSFAFKADPNIDISIQDMDIKLQLWPENASYDYFGIFGFNIENLSGYLKGYAGIDINITMPFVFAYDNNSKSIDFSDDSFAINLADMDVYLSIDNLDLSIIGFLIENFSFPFINLGKVVFSANVTGAASLSLINITTDFVPIYGNWSWEWINTTFGIDSKNGNIKINLLDIENIQGIVNLIILKVFQIPNVSIPFKVHFIIENLIMNGHTNLTIPMSGYSVTRENKTKFIAPSFIGIRLENEPNTNISFDKLIFFFQELLINGTYPITAINFFNVSLGEGVFDFLLRLYIDIRIINSDIILNACSLGFRISDARALKYLNLNLVGIQDTAFVNLTFDKPFEYFELDFNKDFTISDPPYNTYMLLDTHNSTVSLNLSVFIKKEIFDLAIDFFNKYYNTSLPYFFENDQGLIFTNVVIKTDGFTFYTNSAAIPRFIGYLHLEAGEALILVEGEWESLTPGIFSFTIYPGHVQLIFNIEVTDFQIYKNFTLANGLIFNFSGIFTIHAPNAIFDIYWAITDGNLSYLELNFTGRGFIKIDDFLVKFDDTINISWRTLFIGSNLSAPSQLYNLTFVLANDRFVTIAGSLGVYIKLNDLHLQVIINKYISSLNSGLKAFVDIPNLEITFSVESASFKFPLYQLPPPPPPKFYITPAELVIGIEQTETLKAVNPPDPLLIVWRSSNVSIATVEYEGEIAYVTGHAEGNVTITAESGFETAEASVIVTEKFYITPSSATIFINDTVQLTPHKQEDPVTWSSSDITIASVDSLGLVTGHAAGKVIITAIDNSSQIAYSNITVTDLYTIIQLEGNINLAGAFVFTLFTNFTEESIMLNISVNGSASINNFYGKLVGYNNNSIEILIPNTEVKDFRVELIKENKTSPALLSWGGTAKIIPAFVKTWGYIGFGIRLAYNSNISFLTLESLYFNASVESQESSSDNPGTLDSDKLTTLNKELNIEINPDSGKLNLYSDSDSISLQLTNFNFSLYNKINVTIESIQWDKLGRIDWIITPKFEATDVDPSNDSTENGSYITSFSWGFKHYTYYNSSLYIKNLYIGLRFKIGPIDLGWVDFPKIKIFNITDSEKEGYSYWGFDKAKDYINISHDINLNSTINLSFYIDGKFGPFLTGDWEINSRASSNWSLHIVPGSSKHVEWTINEPGFMRFFEIKHIGELDIYNAFTIGPIQFTPGKIIFDYMGLLPLQPTGFLNIDNQGVHGEGDLLKIDFTRFYSITFASFEIDEGTTSISWDFGSDYGWIIINNTASLNLSLFELSWGIDFLKFEKIETSSKIHMKPGDFYWHGEDLINEDFDKKHTFKNSIFEFEVMVFTIKIGDLKVSFDKRDFDFTNYDNTITIKIRKRGNLGDKNNAIYIDTSDYIKMSRTTVSVYLNDIKIIEVSTTIINLKFKFDDWQIGFIDGEFNHSGKIIPRFYVGIFEFLFSLIWRNNNGQYQQMNLNGIKNQQILGITFDATSCTEDITISSNSFEFWDYKISSSIILYSQSYLDFETDLNLTATPEEGQTGHVYAYVDTNGEYIGAVTIEFYNELEDRGLRIIAETFMADEFNISCESEYKNGHWRPKWSTLVTTGEIDGLNLEIWVKFKVLDNWVKIYDSNGLVVIMEGASYQVVAGQTLEFQVYIYCGTAPYTYSWTLPGELTSEQKNPSFTFNELGSYTITVNVIDSKGLIGSTSIIVDVTDQLYGNYPI